jgi:YD repeat-containing protein
VKEPLQGCGQPGITHQRSALRSATIIGTADSMTKMLLALLTVAMTTAAASAEQRTLYDARGNVVGRSATDSQGTTTIYDASGRNVGGVTTSR